MERLGTRPEPKVTTEPTKEVPVHKSNIISLSAHRRPPEGGNCMCRCAVGSRWKNSSKLEKLGLESTEVEAGKEIEGVHHQIQIYNQYDQFVRKFGANILQHPREVTVDSKTARAMGCSKHLEFRNGVVVKDKQEIFINDNRAHCVKVFNYEGQFLRQIVTEGITTIRSLSESIPAVKS